MTADQYHIEVITTQKLQNFAEKRLGSPQWQGLIPISWKRAKAQAQNPHAAPGDPVLVLAFEDNRCIGYHGLLPGLLKRKTQLSKVFWATTFFVADNYRGRGIGRHMIEKIKSFKVDFMVTGMTLAAEQAYLAAGVKQAGSVAFYQLRAVRNIPNRSFGSHLVSGGHLRRDSHLVERLSRHLNQFGFNCRGVDRLSHRKNIRNFESSDKVEFYRNIECVNWMITFPWIYRCDTSSAKRDNYYFSNQRNWFEYILIELYSKKSGLWQGFIVFSLSRHKQRTVLKALDHRLISPVNPAVLLETTLFTAEQIGVDCIELSADWDIDEKVVSAYDFIVKKKKRSYCYYPGDPQGLLQDALSAIHLDYCDGDIAFT